MSVERIKIAARKVQTVSVEFFSFARREARTLLVGLLFTFLSSFGQTFFVSLFVPYFKDVFALTDASYGTMYSMATLGSAVTLPYLGGWIDRTSLRRYGLAVTGGLTLACLSVALSYHVVFLFISLYLLRLTGQGLSSHTGRTAMARAYSEGRGRALSIANLGFPLGEGLLPLLFTGLLWYISWRTAWLGVTGTLLLIFIPVLWFLIKEIDPEEESVSADSGSDVDSSEEEEMPDSTTYLALLLESRFWTLTPAVILPGFWATGLLLYQVQMAEQFQWSRALMATAFVSFAVGRVLFSLMAGPLIDLLSARRLFPLYLLPFGIGLLAAYFHPGSWSAFVYLGCLGMTLGAGGNLKSSLFAELYGTKILGTVRSLFASISVAGTALCPTLMGWLLFADVSFTTILAWAMGSVVMASAMAFYQLYD